MALERRRRNYGEKACFHSLVMVPAWDLLFLQALDEETEHLPLLPTLTWNKRVLSH